jgi:hypothetical protein
MSIGDLLSERIRQSVKSGIGGGRAAALDARDLEAPDSPRLRDGEPE